MTTSKRAKWFNFLGFFVVFVVPMLVAAGLYVTRGHWHFKTKNHGQLVIPAKPLTDLSLRTADGQSASLKQFHGHWVFVLLSGQTTCSKICEKNLYFLRQIHKSLGKNQLRVDRIVLFSTQGSVQAHQRQNWLTQHYRSWKMAFIPANQQKHLFALVSQKNQAGRVLLVDPLGNLVMSYSLSAEPKGILSDMKHLLRVSQVG